MLVVFVVVALAIALTLLGVIIFAPSRRVRDEPPLPMPTQLEILLRGRAILDDDANNPGPWGGTLPNLPRTEDPAWQFDTAELTSLGKLDDVDERPDAPSPPPFPAD